MTAALPVLSDKQHVQRPWSYLNGRCNGELSLVISTLKAWNNGAQSRHWIPEVADDIAFVIKKIPIADGEDAALTEAFGFAGITDPDIKKCIQATLGYKSLPLEDWDSYLKVDPSAWGGHDNFGRIEEEKHYLLAACQNAIAPVIAAIISYHGFPFTELLTFGAGRLHFSMYVLPKVEACLHKKGEFPLISTTETDLFPFIERFPGITKPADVCTLLPVFPQRNRFHLVGAESVFSCMPASAVSVALKEIAGVMEGTLFHVQDAVPEGYYEGDPVFRDAHKIKNDDLRPGRKSIEGHHQGFPLDKIGQDVLL